jgi:predicted  nucleic acid-binding Zn-ribbon protein
MSDVLPILASAITIIGSLVGGGVWLLKVNFRLGQQTLKAKKDLYQERVENLKELVKSLENRLTQTEKKLDDAMLRISAATRTIEVSNQSMVSFVESTEKKISVFESTVLKLSNDLLIIKSKPKGPL